VKLSREQGPQSTTGLDKLFQVSLTPVRDAPFTHAVTDNFFRPDVFDELKRTFPKVEARNASKQWARGLYWGDPEYDRHLDAHPVWRSLFEAIHSQAFVDHIGRQFADTWQRQNCLVDFDQARFIPYCEDRKEKESGGLRRPEHGVNDIWSRLDIYHGWPGYTRAAHLDHRRRLLSMLVYFDSPEEIGMVGGELVLHSAGLDLGLMARLGAYRCPSSWLSVRGTWSDPVVIEPKKNRAAAFPCTPQSWHSVPTIQSLRQPRAFLHIVLSSSHEVWR
jgi:hypothetical protein